ncbi:unnamed protein product, partial [Ilex paraguariensis]
AVVVVVFNVAVVIIVIHSIVGNNTPTQLLLWLGYSTTVIYNYLYLNGSLING